MRAEHICQWIQVETREKDLDVANLEKLVALMQEEFWEGSLIEACAWKTAVLIPKGEGKDL